ncbi:MAG: TIGR00282 family metallophosphoesterase [Candidatus Spechtbacterales bacterium]
MKILFFGDIVGRPGREGVAKILPKLKEKYNPDIVGANVENLAHGHGISKETIREISEAGVDFFTSGNHVWEGKDSKELLQDDTLPLVRPANYPPRAPGKGFHVVQVATKRLLVINLMGRVFMKVQIDCPLRRVDEILAKYTLDNDDDSNKEKIDAIFVDFHAEATSEKRVLGFYLDGRISAMVGTHTHVPTADEQILPKGAGYITDVGMCGAKDSSIGVDKDIMIEEMLTQVPQKKEIAEGGACEVGAVLFDVGKNGLCKKVIRVREVMD